MPPFSQQPTPPNIANNSPSTNPPPPSSTINQPPPPPWPPLNSAQQLMAHHHYQRIPTPPRPKMPTTKTNNWTFSPPRSTTASPPPINQWPPPHPPATSHHHQTSPSPTIPLQHWPLPPKLNIPTDTQKEWESAHRNSHTQAEASTGSAHTQQPPIYSPNKVNSSASTLLSDIKSQPRLQLSHLPDTSGAQTQAIDAMPERSTSTPRTPPTTANSSMTNGTHTPTTVNSAGTQPLDEWKSTP